MKASAIDYAGATLLGALLLLLEDRLGIPAPLALLINFCVGGAIGRALARRGDIDN